AERGLLSGGRVELGLGEGQGPVELHPVGARVREKRDVWEESVRALVPAFTRETWEWHGTYFDFPARNVIPKPYQKPHPPLWVACSNITTIGNAGQWGMGALGFQFVSPEAARAWVTRYYTNLTRHEAKLADYPVNPNIAMVSGFMCAETDAEAEEKAAGWTFFVFCLSHYGRHGIPNPGQGNMWELYQEWRHTEKAQETLRSGLIGSPETEGHTRYDHQNEDIVRLTPDELKRKMAAKEAAQGVENASRRVRGDRDRVAGHGDGQ